MFSTYFNLKHAIIPDLDFGFIKAIKPYNFFVLALSFSELFCLTAWNYFDGALLVTVALDDADAVEHVLQIAADTNADQPCAHVAVTHRAPELRDEPDRKRERNEDEQAHQRIEPKEQDQREHER